MGSVILGGGLTVWHGRSPKRSAPRYCLTGLHISFAAKRMTRRGGENSHYYRKRSAKEGGLPAFVLDASLKSQLLHNFKQFKKKWD